MALSTDSITVTYDEGASVDIKLKPSDLIRWERHFAMSSEKIETIEHVTYLTFCALIRLGEVPASSDFMEWADTVAEIGDGPLPAPLAPPKG